MNPYTVCVEIEKIPLYLHPEWPGAIRAHLESVVKGQIPLDVLVTPGKTLYHVRVYEPQGSWGPEVEAWLKVLEERAEAFVDSLVYRDQKEAV